MIGYYFTKTFYNSADTFPISELTHYRKAFVFFSTASHNYSMINCVTVFIAHFQFTVDFFLVDFKYLTLHILFHFCQRCLKVTLSFLCIILIFLWILSVSQLWLITRFFYHLGHDISVVLYYCLGWYGLLETVEWTGVCNKKLVRNTDFTDHHKFRHKAGTPLL